MHYITRTTHTVCARFQIASIDYAVATQDVLRGSTWHDAALTHDAPLANDWAEAVLKGNSLRLTIAARTDAHPAGLPAYIAARDTSVDGLRVAVDVITSVEWADGTTQEFVETQTLTCIGRERAAGSVTLLLSDIEDDRLNALYPIETYTATEFPGISPLDVGRAKPSVVGVVEKVPMARVSNASPWTYVVAKRCVPATALSVVLSTYYRGHQPADARVASGFINAIPPDAYRRAQASAEQRDFNGSEYRIFADITSATFTAPQIIRQLLTDAGCTVDNATFTACETWAAGEGLLVDCDFGAWGQRTTRAILEDLLYIARAALTRKSDGSYGITYDGPASTFIDYNADAGDAIEILSLSEASQPSKVGIRYRPSPRDPANTLQFTILRDVPGGTQGEERPRECRYVRRHEVADKTAYYYAQRAAHSQRLRLRIYRTTHALGDTLRITSAAWGQVASEWRVRRVTRIVGGVEVECERYSAALVTYVPGPLPGEPGADYTPDYSNTPPDAPTGLRITAGGTALAGDGAATAHVTVDALPPPANWERIQFSAVHNVTGEIPGIIRGEPITGGREGTVLTGLRPGEVYKLLAWAENAFGVQGVVQGTFDATAIGGGASATTFTAPGYATLPANVTGIVAQQAPSRLIQVRWNAVTTANLREYVLERRIGAGAYAEVWRGQARSYVDRAVTYGSTYQYRIRARDLWGNFSAGYNTSTAVTLSTGTIYGGSSWNDIGNSTVATNNRTTITTISQNYTIGLGSYGTAITIPHSLGFVPLATAAMTGGGLGDHIININGISSSQITAYVTWRSTWASAPTITTASGGAGGGAHTHSIGSNSYPLNAATLPINSGTAQVYIW